MTIDKHNPFKIAQQQLDEAAALLGMDPGTHAALREPMRELHVSLPVKMDNGETRVFKGFRVQYNDVRGPTKGGLRFHPEETIDTVRALAIGYLVEPDMFDPTARAVQQLLFSANFNPGSGQLLALLGPEALDRICALREAHERGIDKVTDEELKALGFQKSL